MWKALDIDDLRLILSEDETAQLNQYSLDQSMTAVINDTMNMVSDAWRGALSAKGYALDSREHFTPGSYAYYILVHCRWAVWTRFPNSKQIALDDARKQEYEKRHGCGKHSGALEPHSAMVQHGLPPVPAA